MKKQFFLINFSDLDQKSFLDGFIQIGNLQYYILKYVRNLKKSYFRKKIAYLTYILFYKLKGKG